MQMSAEVYAAWARDSLHADAQLEDATREADKLRATVFQNTREISRLRRDAKSTRAHAKDVIEKMRTEIATLTAEKDAAWTDATETRRERDRAAAYNKMLVASWHNTEKQLNEAHEEIRTLSATAQSAGVV